MKRVRVSDAFSRVQHGGGPRWIGKKKRKEETTQSH